MGVEPWWTTIVRHWNSPDLGLGSVLPWLASARALLEAEDALGLERQLMGIVWDYLDRLTESYPFAFEQVCAYVFKWDISERWLSYRPDLATAQFRERIDEACGEYRELYSW
jgi:hypothetical protein